MTQWRKLLSLLPWVRARQDREIHEELDALRQFAAPGELGNLTVAAEDAGAVTRWGWFEQLGQDLRYAIRSMTHQKTFTLLVIASLALGIGANSAIYSFVDSILIRPLPVPHPESLVIMKWQAKGYAFSTSGESWSTDGSSFEPGRVTATIFPYDALAVFRQADDVIASAFGYFVLSPDGLALTIHDRTDAIKGELVTGGYFAGMEVTPVAGRLLTPDDDRPGQAAVAVLSERVCRTRFGSATACVGQTIRLNDQPFVVVGVAPAAFFGAEPGAIPDAFVPLRAESLVDKQATEDDWHDDHAYWLEIMARLKPGLSVAEAQAALAPRFHGYIESTTVTAQQRADQPKLLVAPGGAGLDNLRRLYAEPMTLLMGTVALILLIACANIASLLLSKAVARRREMAIRLSIGATRSRILRQLLTESVLLACLGGAAGLGLAWWGIRLLTTLLAGGRENFTLHAEMSGSVLVVACLLSVGAGILFGLAPARQAIRVEVLPALKDARSSDSAPRFGRVQLGQVLVVAQIVLSLVLLIGAGLFGRSLSRLHGIPLGFDQNRVLLFTVHPSEVGYTQPDLPRLYDTIRARLATLPGIQAVTESAAPIPMGGGSIMPVGIVGATPVPGTSDRPRGVNAGVGPAFFSTMRMPIVGRDFTEADRANSPPVVVVNYRLATQFGITNPVGRQLTIGKTTYDIVGVVNDAVILWLTEDPRPIVYFPLAQAPRVRGATTYELRTAGDPLDSAALVRTAVQTIDPRLAISNMKSQSAYIDEAIRPEIALARLCTGFAGLALLLACIGVYGTVAFNVSRRTNEIGIRMTLGAGRGRIAWTVLRSVLTMTAIGLAIGLPIAFVGTRYLKSLLFSIQPTDPTSLASATGLLLVLSLVAGGLPARRASRISPMRAIRHE